MMANSPTLPALQLRDATVHYGLKPILDRISLDISAGSRVAVIGPNGVGKTTLLKALAGALSPQEGEVRVQGLVRRSSADIELECRRRVTFIADDLWFPRQRTGWEFLMAIGELYEVPYRRLIDHIERLLSLFGIREIAMSAIDSYSTGQKKKVSLCAAMVTDTPILLLDEPFSGGLDPLGIIAMQHLLKSTLRENDRTVIFSTPVPEILEETADRILVIREARIAADLIVADLKMRYPQQSFTQTLQSLIFPESEQQIRQYQTSANS